MTNQNFKEQLKVLKEKSESLERDINNYETWLERDMAIKEAVDDKIREIDGVLFDESRDHQGNIEEGTLEPVVDEE